MKKAVKNVRLALKAITELSGGKRIRIFWNIQGRCECGHTLAIQTEVDGKYYTVCICDKCGYGEEDKWEPSDIVKITRK